MAPGKTTGGKFPNSAPLPGVDLPLGSVDLVHGADNDDDVPMAVGKPIGESQLAVAATITPAAAGGHEAVAKTAVAERNGAAKSG